MMKIENIDIKNYLVIIEKNNKHTLLNMAELYSLYRKYIELSACEYLQENYPQVKNVYRVACRVADLQIEDGYSEYDAVIEVLDDLGLI